MNGGANEYFNDLKKEVDRSLNEKERVFFIRKIQAVQKIIEIVQVDFRNIKERLETLMVAMRRDVDRKVPGAMKFQEMVLEMGDKLYSLLQSDSRVCVPIEIPPIPCEKCYFISICKLVKRKI